MSTEPELFTMSEADALRHFLRRIEEETLIPADKRQNLAWLQSATSLAHIYATAALRAFDVGDAKLSSTKTGDEVQRLTTNTSDTP